MTLAEQGGRKVFKVSYAGEVVPLVDSGSLNRWASVGVVDRHKIAVASDGITIDGRVIPYADGRAAAELLERLLNRPQTPPPRPASSASKTVAQPGATWDATALADSVKVSRDGFEFHVTFLTRFGENKTEKLEAALELFQNMRAFKPHVNIQKSGIRLVVTRWDGENFVEEAGIENIEHATPEEVEQMICDHLQGTPDRGATPAAAGRHSKPAVTRVQLVRRAHDQRHHLVLHRADGTSEEGLLLIRPNLAKLGALRLFRPGVTLSMTAMNDRLILDRCAPGSAKETASFFLDKAEDVVAAEAALNECLAPPVAEPELRTAAPPRVAPSEPVLPESAQPASTMPGVASVVPEPVKEVIPEPPAAIALPAETPTVEQGPGAAVPEPAVEAVETPAKRPEAVLKEWLAALLQSQEGSPAEETNREVFHALRDKFERSAATNDHGFPALTLEFTGKSGSPEQLELVLTPHFLICTFPFGYVRFGMETRLFLTRLDDFAEFPGYGLRGVAENPASGAPVLIVSDDCARFFQNHSDRSYRSHAAEILTTGGAVSPERLIWPCSVEERLFRAAAETARSYGLPVSSAEIVLDPSASVFIGFRRAVPHGMEFRDEDDFVRFTPAGVEISDEGRRHTFIGGGVLMGWALDGEGRVCAIYREASGFVPPEGTKLLHFLTEQDKESAAGSLNLLAWVPG
ncbi:MAG: hypothetical protein AB9869_16260 [Verrucomicrobiia bacterium]